MERSILCLSCLNGQLKAVAVQRGSPSRSWERPAPVDDFTSFGTVAKEAVEKIGYTGQQVALVLAHPRLNDQIMEVPPVKGWTLDRFLQRRAQRLKTFDGEAVWSQQPAMATKNSEAVLLHLFPKELLDQLARGCKEANLQLVRVLPATAVLSNQLKQLPLEKDEVTLLAAETGPTTTVVIGRKDGRVCLGRVLHTSWNLQPDRVAVDLTRTIGFAEQQTGATVTSAWMFGPGAPARLPEMQALLKLPARSSPVECQPFYWAEQAAKHSAKGDGDLVSLEAREAPQRRKFLRVTGVVLLILFLASLGIAGYFEWLRRNDLKTIEKLDADLVRIREVKTDWQQRHADRVWKSGLIRIVSDEKPAPLAGWFLGYLSEAAPEDLLLTDLRVTRTNNLWLVRIAGTAQPTTNAAPEVVFREAFAEMINNLTTGPFQLEIQRSALGDEAENPTGPTQDQSARPPAVDALPAIAPGTEIQTPKTNTFVIEGIIRSDTRTR
jgi:hypothetical protein